MKSRDLIATAATALQANPLRSILTTLGIVIGCGSVIAMAAIGAGAEARITEMIDRMGSNLIMVLPGSGISRGASMGGESKQSLTQRDVDGIREEAQYVAQISGSISSSVQIIAAGKNWRTRTSGVEKGYLAINKWIIELGREISEEEYALGRKVVVLGASVSKNIFDDQDPIGSTVRINRIPFTVIGVLEAKGQGFGGSDLDDVTFVPLKTMRQRLAGKKRGRSGQIQRMHIQASSAETLTETEREVEQILRRLHEIKEGNKDDFRIRNLAQMVTTRTDTIRTMTLLLASVAAISLLVGGIGIMNIMLVTVTERTREIGLRMALGAKRSQIRWQFLTESVILSLSGGTIGVGLGFGASYFLQGIDFIEIIHQPRAIGLAVLVSMGVGIVFGFYPAHRASLMTPVEALRSD
jgi:putative ABC transport system permease protein